MHVRLYFPPFCKALSKGLCSFSVHHQGKYRFGLERRAGPGNEIAVLCAASAFVRARFPASYMKDLPVAGRMTFFLEIEPTQFDEC